MITIFTPTYNRAHTLNRLYNSLCQQTSFNFEWVIVDDGSSDNTETLIENLRISTSDFQITYLKQENGGKHRAINTGVKLAKGEFFFIVDSDDYLTNNAISLIESNVIPIRNNDQLCGIVGLRCFNKSDVIGDKCLTIDTDFLSYRIKYKIKGDRAEIIKTTIMREYPFPEFPDERFCTEAIVWNRISQKYIARYLNLKIYICEYLDGGLTDSIRMLLRENPQSMSLYNKELLSHKLPFILKLKSLLNFLRYSFIYQKKRISSLFY